MTLPPAGQMVVAAAAAHGACHWCVDRALRRQAWYAALPLSKRVDVDVNVTWLLLGTPLPLLYLASLPELGGTATARWRAASDRTTLTLIMHVGQSVYELLTYLRSDKGAEFILHHLAVITTYGLVLYCGEMHFWAAWAGTVEATNPSLCILQLGLLSGIGRGSRREMANGVCLWLLFLVVRVLGIPVWLVAYWHDVRSGAVSAIDASAAGLGHPTPALRALRLVAPAVQMLLWLISCFWFRKLTAGMLKAVRGAGADSKKRE